MKPIITKFNDKTGDVEITIPVPFTLKDGIEYANMMIADIPKYEDTKDYNVFDLIRENQQLKEQLESSEKARKEAIEFINDKSDKGYNFGWILQNEEIYKLLEILYVDKGEQR